MLDFFFKQEYSFNFIVITLFLFILIRSFPAIEICQQNAEVNLIYNIFIIMNIVVVFG